MERENLTAKYAKHAKGDEMKRCEHRWVYVARGRWMCTLCRLWRIRNKAGKFVYKKGE